MQKLRFLPLAAMTLALSLFTGCDDEDGSVTINGFGVDNAMPEAGKSFNTKGTADFETDKATVSYAFSPSAGITGPSSFTIASGASLGKQIDISSSAATGTYSVTVTVTDEDGVAASQTATFCVEVCSGTPPTGTLLPDNGGANTITLGAQSASAGSFLNVDGFESFKSDNATYAKTAAQKQSIDVVFFASAAGVPTFYAPTAAADADLGGIKSWGSDAKSTIIVDAGTTPIETKEAAISAIGSKSTTQAAVVSGHYYALKLSNNKYAVINAILAGSDKSATVTVDILSE